MFRELAAPAVAFTTALLYFGVPTVYQQHALLPSAGLLAFLLGLIWVLFRGYRARVIGTHNPLRLFTYLVAFLALNHAVNIYCFLNIEAPLEFPWATFEASWFIQGTVVITGWILSFVFVDWVVLAVTLRCLGARLAWSMAARIAIYSLPASLLVALPGASSWRVAMVSWALVQLVTLWRVQAEGHLAPSRSSVMDASLLE